MSEAAYPKPAPGTGALYGKQWEPRQLAAWNYAAGWSDPFELTAAVAIELAESQGFDHAIHVNLDGTEDRGVWQLNSIHKAVTDEIAYDPVPATDVAFDLWKARGNFSDWAAFTSGVYLRDSYLGRAVRGVANFIAEDMLGWPVKPRADGSAYEHRFETPMLSYQHQTAGALHWIEQAKKDLGYGAKTKAQVQQVQLDLSRGFVAGKSLLPQ